MRKIESSDKSPRKTEYADDRNDDQAKVGDLSESYTAIALQAVCIKEQTFYPDDIYRFIGKDKSLDAFLSCHTSEDNESFEELIIETEERRRTKVRT